MEQDRRNFMARSGALAAAPMFVPRSAWGANDRLAYAVIGTGGRGRYISRNFQKLGAQCVAVSDVYEPNLEKARADAPGATGYVDYRELLRQNGIDAVVIATPDHQHYPCLQAALNPNKHVNLENPLSHSPKTNPK